MEKKSYPTVKKRFIIGLSPALILLLAITVAVCLAYAFLNG